MTAKQQALLENLPKCNYNVSKASKLAGYTNNSCISNVYTYLKKSKNIKDYFNPETIKKDIKYAWRLCKKKEDLTNMLRSLELQSKIEGMQKDISENTHKIQHTPIEHNEIESIRNRLNSNRDN